MPQLPGTDLTVSDLCLGGNVFGWTADEPTSFALLDRFNDATPGTVQPFVDTAEMYGNGASETILGAWMAARGNRDRMVVATKASPGHEGASPGGPRDRGGGRAVAAEPADRHDRPLLRALRRPHDPARGDAHRLRRSWSGRARCATWRPRTTPPTGSGGPPDLRGLGLARYVVLQPHYNLMERAVYEDALRDTVAELGMGSLPYFALAKGFLTGKYRAGEQVDSPRAKGAAAYVGERGDRVLAALGEIAAAHRRAGAGGRAALAGRPAHGGRADRERAHRGAAGRPAADAGPGPDRRRSGSSSPTPAPKGPVQRLVASLRAMRGTGSSFSRGDDVGADRLRPAPG